MTAWLIDTNVVSELRKPKPARSVLAFFEAQSLTSMYISIVSLSELRYGAACVDDAHKRQELLDWIEHTVRPMFDRRVLAVDEEVMLLWRIMLEKGRQSNYTFPQPDLMLAATAERYGMIVVSRDQIFNRAGVTVHNPWTKS